MTTVGAMRLWDDNPTLTDLLGIDTVVEAVATALRSPSLDPVTVCLQSPWGGGKSSALEMLGERFADDKTVLVVRVDPWEFEDSDDVRGTLIGHILTDLRNQRPQSFAGQVGDLLKRIAWKRVGKTIATSALTMTMNPLDLVKAFTPEEKEQATDMAGFRDEFEKMMVAAKDVTKVVVLVDDLDRCKPSSVVASLEAIKVFLAVKKMAFVLAAEEDMIRWSIAQDTHAGGRSEFADRYLEKIVQLPVTLPRLSQDAAETYVALLLCQKSAEENPDSFKALVGHVAERRRNREFPLLHGGDYPTTCHVPTSGDMRMATLVARGLSGDQWGSPRAIKRFLNAWGVREAIATARGVSIEPDVSLKLYLLEQRFPDDFKALQAVDAADRADFVKQWEDWAREVEGASKPGEVSEGTKMWAASDPSLVPAMDQFDRYTNLAASFTSFSAGSGLSDADLELLTNLQHESDTTRREAVSKVLGADATSRRTIFERLLTRLPSADHPSKTIESACAIVAKESSFDTLLCDGLRRYGLTRLSVGDIIELGSQVPGKTVDGFLKEVAEDQRVADTVRTVAEEQAAERSAKS